MVGGSINSCENEKPCPSGLLSATTILSINMWEVSDFLFCLLGNTTKSYSVSPFSWQIVRPHDEAFKSDHFTLLGLVAALRKLMLM